MNTKRTFLERALASGVDCGLLSAADILRFVSADVLAHHLPNGLKTKLLKAALSAKEMTPELVVSTLGTVAIAANVPTNVVWECVADAAKRALGVSDGDKTTTTATAVEVAAASVSAATKPTPIHPSVPLPVAKTKPVASDSAKKPDKVAKTTKAAKSKPNVKVKGVSKKEPERLPGVPPVGDAAHRAQTAPLIPKSEFDVDTDVGEDWSVDEDIDDIDDIEVVEEADSVGAMALDDPALDWKAEEETVARTGTRNRKR